MTYQECGVRFTHPCGAQLTVDVDGEAVVIQATGGDHQSLVWDLLLMLEGVEATLRALGQTQAADRAEQLAGDIYDVWQRIEYPSLYAQDAG